MGFLSRPVSDWLSHPSTGAKNLRSIACRNQDHKMKLNGWAKLSPAMTLRHQIAVDTSVEFKIFGGHCPSGLKADHPSSRLTGTQVTSIQVDTWASGIVNGPRWINEVNLICFANETDHNVLVRQLESTGVLER